MSRKQHTLEQIIGKLREAEVALAQGQTVGQVSVPGLAPQGPAGPGGPPLDEP